MKFFARLVNGSLSFAFITLLFFFAIEWRHSSTRRHLTRWLVADRRVDGEAEKEQRVFDGTVSNSSPTRRPHLATSRIPPSDSASLTSSKRHVPVSNAYVPSRFHVVVIILSAPRYAERREAARRIWRPDTKEESFDEQLRRKLYYMYKFICGKEKQERLNVELRKESQREGDILLANLPDTYKHLTQKVLWAMRWAMAHVQFNYFLKTDDDVFINLREFFVRVPWSAQKQLYLGYKSGREKSGRGVRVVRSPQSKWYVPRSVYEPEFFPPYIQGHGYLLSHDLIGLCLHKAKARVIFHIEDAFFGILLAEAKVKAQHMEHTYDRFTSKACNDRQAFIIGGVNPMNLTAMVENTRKKLPICTNITLKPASLSRQSKSTVKT